MRVLPRRRGPRGDAAAVLALREEVHGTSGATNRKVRGYRGGVLKLLARMSVFLFSSQAPNSRDPRFAPPPALKQDFVPKHDDGIEEDTQCVDILAEVCFRDFPVLKMNPEKYTTPAPEILGWIPARVRRQTGKSRKT